jgi:hypothetical protein
MTVSGWFCDTFLLWTSINALFLCKPVYSSKKELIDSIIYQARANIEKVYGLVDSLIPKYKDPEVKTD